MKSNNSKKLIATLLVMQLVVAPKLFAQNIAINTTGNTPDASAMLDVVSTTQGFLMPRMTTVQRTAITTPATGLQVYDLTTNTVWYYNGTSWINSNSSASAWGITGNSGTNSGTNFIGTTDNASLSINTNGTQRMLVDSTGKVGVASGTAPLNAGLTIGAPFTSYADPVTGLTASENNDNGDGAAAFKGYVEIYSNPGGGNTQLYLTDNANYTNGAGLLQYNEDGNTELSDLTNSLGLVATISLNQTGANPNSITLSSASSAAYNEILDANGNVGIGTNIVPTARLDIDNGGSTTTAALKLRTPFSGSATDSILTWNAADSSVREIKNSFASQTKTLNFSAEYAGAILTTNGLGAAGTIGSMTAVNDTTSGAYTNAYNWTSGEATTQSYNVILRVQVPSDFGSWAPTTSFSLNYITSASNASVDYTIEKSDGTAIGTTVTGLSGTSWAANTQDLSASSVVAAGDYFVVIFTLHSSNNGVAKIGDVNLTYISQ